ncbi:MAG TPA: hypothetical protein VGJ13_19930 [Pseudonocardiaceae bacterium]|jgi:hypothetical protein
MKLNSGAPVWHTSLSLWTPDQRTMLRSPTQVERAAVELLAGVGNDREWWIWRPAPRVGHLRVGLTVEEVAVLPEVPAEHDAGDSGPERRRTPARRPG